MTRFNDPATPSNVIPTPLVSRMTGALSDWSGPAAFFFEYADTTVMHAPGGDFFNEIADAPLPSLGGSVKGAHILEAFAPANDTLPSPLEDFQL